MRIGMAVLAVGVCFWVGCGEPEEDVSPPDRAALAVGGVVEPISPGPIATLPPPPIVNGTLTTTPNWVVEISFAGTFCSGWAINEHWVLTASHCVEGQMNGSSVTVFRASGLGTQQQIYSGPASFFPHPDHPAQNATHDVGLVLLQSFGLRIDLTGQAKMYSDTRRPWADSSLPRDFDAVGWGLSTPDPNDSTGCLGSGGQLRVGGGMTVDVSGAATHFVTSAIGFQFPCSGDSGTPWLLTRGSATDGFTDMGFAVHSGRRGSPKKAQAATIDDNRSFIESTMLAGAGMRRYGEWCHDVSLGSFNFRQCDELSRGWGRLIVPAGCIEASGATPGSAVRLAACLPESAPQIWSFVPSGEIKSLLGPNLCLDAPSAASGAALQVSVCNNSVTQRFGNTARGEIRSGLDFNQCVSGFDDRPVLTMGFAARSAPPGSAPPAATASTARIVGVGDTIFGARRLAVSICNQSANQAWAWN
jgi:trypsin/ricin-type beta-trefoil lectin protein